MLSTRKLIVIGAVLVVAASGIALAETTPDQHSMGPDHMQQTMPPGQHPMGPDHMPEMMRQHQGMMPMGGDAGMHGATTTPTLPGQDAFGAIQEVVGILDADPKTDWSKVDLEALRQHLIDMNEVTLKADAAPKQIDGGLEIAVTVSNSPFGNGTASALQPLTPFAILTHAGIIRWIATRVRPLPVTAISKPPSICFGAASALSVTSFMSMRC
jgi:hypothetical protein